VAKKAPPPALGRADALHHLALDLHANLVAIDVEAAERVDDADHDRIVCPEPTIDETVTPLLA
jgi:hypothetical protein